MPSAYGLASTCQLDCARWWSPVCDHCVHLVQISCFWC